ncbi:SymE family type I addiction module toxin [Xanthomonas bundabergensis]|uniref:SymE family type I addiction module toxin n=1 Tax=Xanthomonas bundabergensis TaxID=3160842 RepID=UPI003512D2A2
MHWRCRSLFRRTALHRRPPVLVLRLRGLWLERLGFVSGSKVRTTVRAGEVAVSVVEGDAISTRI